METNTPVPTRYSKYAAYECTEMTIHTEKMVKHMQERLELVTRADSNLRGTPREKWWVMPHAQHVWLVMKDEPNQRMFLVLFDVHVMQVRSRWHLSNEECFLEKADLIDTIHVVALEEHEVWKKQYARDHNQMVARIRDSLKGVHGQQLRQEFASDFAPANPPTAIPSSKVYGYFLASYCNNTGGEISESQMTFPTLPAMMGHWCARPKDEPTFVTKVWAIDERRNKLLQVI